MQKINKSSAVKILIASLVLGFAGVAMQSPVAHALQSTVDLGSAEPFAILSGTPNITDAPTSTITGNVGLSPAPGAGIELLCTQVTGTIYAVDATGDACFTEDGPLLVLVKNDLTTAYTDAAGRIPATVVPEELGGTTKTAGVYVSASTAFSISNIGPLVLDAQNDPSAVFIFQVSASAPGLTVGPASTVSLINGAQACNVFWRVDSAAIDTTAVFKGTILALNSITVANGANIEGRLLARNGSVTLINDIVTVPTCVETLAATSTPKLPNTGVAGEAGNNTLAVNITVGIVVIALLSFLVIQKKHTA